MRTSIHILCCIVLFGFCKKEPPIVPPDPPIHIPTVQLRADDIGLSDVWLTVKITDTLQPRTIQLQRNYIPIITFTLAAQETTIIDTTALPQRHYTYTALRLQGNTPKDSSAVLNVTTMDTTSHDFTWTIETIGYQNSIVRDVAIVNDTLVYAVGLFYEKDTSISAQTRYNIARWNGKEWKLMRVMVETRLTSQIPPHYYFPDEIHGIHVFAHDEIWLATSIEFIRWDGKSEMGKEYIYMPNTPVRTVWGTSPNNIYGAGPNGSFVKYDGTTWTKLDSLTNTSLTDIYGTSDGKEVWAVGYVTDGRSAVLRYKNNVLQRIYTFNEAENPIQGYISTVWINDGFAYLGGSRRILYKYSFKENRFKNDSILFREYFTFSIHGTGRNNIFMACEGANLYHWNGSTWKHLNQFSNTNRSLYKVSVSTSLIVCVGTEYGQSGRKGLIIFGKQ